MYIGFIKLKENGFFVWYRLETAIPDSIYIDRFGRERGLSKISYGYYRFDKLTEAFEVNKDKSDHYFHIRKHEVVHVHARLITIKESHGIFPSSASINTG